MQILRGFSIYGVFTQTEGILAAVIMETVTNGI
jgi:hypothetical protein